MARGTAGLDPNAVRHSLERGAAFLTKLQRADGSWRGEYGGPMFLLPMYVAAQAISGRDIPAGRRRGMIASLLHYQNPDGSLGLHELDSGCMFTSALGYSALRLLGLGPHEPALVRMRRWMHAEGTALGAAAWGKFFLALLNVYPYAGLHPITPELWLLPYAAPIHPGRMWCHCRMVYLPMAWLYGARAQGPVDETIRALRDELYDRPYAAIDFSRHRDTVAACDDRYPLSRVYSATSRVLDWWERGVPRMLRRRALAEIADQVAFEDRATHYLDIGPVNSVLNSLVHHFRQPDGEQAARSFEALDSYLVETPEGVKFNGYNNTALWDTAFATQALLACPDTARQQPNLRRAFDFIAANQIGADVPAPERHYRHRSRGGWPFSDAEHGWPITDCTAEGLKTSQALAELVDAPLSAERQRQAVELILSLQNRDGGWSSYERKRAGGWLELFNPSQVFAGIMVDHSYPECTSACLQALVHNRGRFGAGPDRRIDRALRHGVRFLRASQRPAGGWFGSWAVCFSYGTWFGISGLRASGVPAGDPALQRAAGFLIERQNPDGGWGEHHRSCAADRWLRAPSTAAQTAWSLMGLVRCGLGAGPAARRGAAWLVQRQQADGDWPEEPLVGVFNRSTLIDYENYRRYFPIWALAELARATKGNGGATGV